jgi:hypothetical protein
MSMTEADENALPRAAPPGRRRKCANGQRPKVWGQIFVHSQRTSNFPDVFLVRYAQTAKDWNSLSHFVVRLGTGTSSARECSRTELLVAVRGAVSCCGAPWSPLLQPADSRGKQETKRLGEAS